MKVTYIKKDRIAPMVISGLFHPLLMPSLGVWLIFNSGSMLSLINPAIQLKILGIIFGFTFLFPAMILPVFIYFRLMGHWEATERNERIFPIAITAIIYYFTYSFLKGHQVLTFIALFIPATSIVMILLMIANFFTKISLHMAGIGGICGLLLFMSIRISSINGWFFIVALFLSGLIAFARLKLNAHSPMQIVYGFAAGIIPVFSLFMFV
jgi:membrane-associated phospholipid phosphatase